MQEEKAQSNVRGDARGVGEERKWMGQDKSQSKGMKGAEKYIKYIVMAAAVFILAVHPPARDRVIFLDVGQGDCCLVQTSAGDTYLFDCGSSSRSSVGKYILLPCLKYYGISRLDAVFVSHPDMDHMNGVVELLELAEENHIDIKQLILPAIQDNQREEEFCELLEAANGNMEGTAGRTAENTAGRTAENKAGEDGTGKNRIRVAYLAAGESWESGEARFICLHPEKGYFSEESNVYSLCVYAEFRTFSLLLTGDVEGEGERALTHEMAERAISDITILKVAHHGSGNSTSEEFLEQTCPGVAVISCGKNNRYGHPHPDTLQRLEEAGSKVLTTPECGAIIIEIGKKVRIDGFLKRERK